MADDHGTAPEGLQRSFERAQRVHVEIIGGLVEQQHVASRRERPGEVHPVAFAARKISDALLLIRAGEVERCDKRSAVDFACAVEARDAQRVVPARDLFIDGAAVVQHRARLIHICNVDGLADRDRARIWLLVAGQQPEQRRLAGAVRTDHSDDPARRQAEREIVEQQRVAVGLDESIGLDDLRTQAPRHRDGDLQRTGSMLGVSGPAMFRQQLLIRADACPALRLSCPWRHAHPLQLASQRAGSNVGLALLREEAVVAMLEPCAVVAFEGMRTTVVDLEDPAGHVVQEVAVMGDGHHCP